MNIPQPCYKVLHVPIPHKGRLLMRLIREAAASFPTMPDYCELNPENHDELCAETTVTETPPYDDPSGFGKQFASTYQLDGIRILKREHVSPNSMFFGWETP